MSRQRLQKRRTSGARYGYRAVAAIVAAAIFPVFFLAPLMRISYSVLLMGESELTISLRDLLFAQGGALQPEVLLGLEALAPLKPTLAALSALLVLALAAALATVIASLCCGRYAATLCIAGAGTASLLGALIPLHTASAMLADGTVSIGTLLSQVQETGVLPDSIGGISSSLLQNASSLADLAVQEIALHFDAGYYGALLLMAFLLFWSGTHLLIGIGEGRQPAHRAAHKRKGR